jgi:hypothetical protein
MIKIVVQYKRRRRNHPFCEHREGRQLTPAIKHFASRIEAVDLESILLILSTGSLSVRYCPTITLEWSLAWIPIWRAYLPATRVMFPMLWIGSIFRQRSVALRHGLCLGVLRDEL